MSLRWGALVILIFVRVALAGDTAPLTCAKSITQLVQMLGERGAFAPEDLAELAAQTAPTNPIQYTRNLKDSEALPYAQAFATHLNESGDRAATWHEVRRWLNEEHLPSMGVERAVRETARAESRDVVHPIVKSVLPEKSHSHHASDVYRFVWNGKSFLTVSVGVSGQHELALIDAQSGAMKRYDVQWAQDMPSFFEVDGVGYLSIAGRSTLLNLATGEIAQGEKWGAAAVPTRDGTFTIEALANPGSPQKSVTLKRWGPDAVSYALGDIADATGRLLVGSSPAGIFITTRDPERRHLVVIDPQSRTVRHKIPTAEGEGHRYAIYPTASGPRVLLPSKGVFEIFDPVAGTKIGSDLPMRPEGMRQDTPLDFYDDNGAARAVYVTKSHVVVLDLEGHRELASFPVPEGDIATPARTFEYHGRRYVTWGATTRKIYVRPLDGTSVTPGAAAVSPQLPRDILPVGASEGHDAIVVDDFGVMTRVQLVGTPRK